MKKFSQFKPVRRINEQEVQMQSQQIGDGGQIQAQSQSEPETTPANLPENIQGQEENKETGNISKFFSKLFEAREMAHIYHLQVKGDDGSYAAHMALGSFYDSLLGLIDSVIEVYQGQYGIVEEYDVIDTKDTKTKEKVEYFEELASFVKSERKCISAEDTHLQNIIDEIIALIYQTLYKLKYNK